METEYRVHLLVSKYQEREGEEGARLAGEGGQSAMQAGQPRETLEEDGMLQSP